MTKFISFNPLKDDEITDVHYFLRELVEYSDKEICFLNDKVGRYFSPLRSYKNTSICLTDERDYMHYSILKDNVYLAKTVYERIFESFDYRIIPSFEKRLQTEKNPVVCSFILFCLHRLSNEKGDSLCNYSEENMEKLHNSIASLDSFYLGATNIYSTPPEDCFLISNDTEFDKHEGLLLTNRKLKCDLARTIDRLNIYYINNQK